MDVKGGQIECVKRRLELTGEGDFLEVYRRPDTEHKSEMLCPWSCEGLIEL